MQAIETVYKGYRFRSRLEARWGVFFDALGIDWQYEPEGYKLSDGTGYLPDFFLPTFSGGMYAEVKPHGGDFRKAESFARESGKTMWFCEGEPSTRAYYIAETEEGDFHILDGIPNFDQADGYNRMFWVPGYCDNDNMIPEDYLYHTDFKTGRKVETPLLKAVTAARQARFEHGQNGYRAA